MALLGFGSLTAAQAMAARVKAATGREATVRVGGRVGAWYVELPPLRADEYDALRRWAPEQPQCGGVKRR